MMSVASADDCAGGAGRMCYKSISKGCVLTRPIVLAVAWACGQLLYFHPAYGQVAPDGGAVLKELQRTEPGPKPAAAKPEVRLPEERIGVADTGARILVREFRISGATLIAAQELQQEISASIGAELTLADLRKVALRLSDLYRRKGFFARALVPQQRVQDGVVEIAVIESRLAAIDIEVLPGTRLNVRGNSSSASRRWARP